ncbi:site-specific integrase [Aquidulcibacter sp.]|uniref:tyrosine-type recombinase/integrase n=1 Tax=Aquidulcibacter sp. TaxID=2052990 RepID=UPI0025B9F751|nr:site-specific integrase [Aquidulcibacter sp.]
MAKREPSRRARLNKRTVDAIQPDADKDIIVMDTEVKGFRVRIRPSGRKTFEFRYRVPGRQRLYVIGDLGEKTADEALKEATRLAGQVASGGDPQGEKLGERETVNAARTVKEIIAEYLREGPTDKPDKRASSWDVDRINLQRHALPVLGKKFLSELTPQVLANWQAAVADGKTALTEKTKARGVAKVTGGRGAASRAMQCMSAMMEWAVARGLVEANPCKRVKRYQSNGKERYLSEDEGAAIWEAIEALQGEGAISKAAADCFRLLALTGARRGEIVGLRWPEVDLKRGLLLLPPLRHKTGGQARPKAIPMPTPAVSILAGIPRRSDWVFPNSRLDGPMEPPKRAWAKVVKAAGVSGVSPHTFRHTVASWAVADGQSLAVVGKVLGHSRPQTTARYAHFAASAGVEALEAVAGRYLSHATRQAKEVSEDAA